jgi:SAM-dependent methyltransferase
MSRPSRVDYDEIADRYGSQPHRARAVDPELLAFAGQCSSGAPAVLDLGCGTGNQLIADRGALPGARLVSVDRSAGMLRQARLKAPEIAWVRADAAAIPFAPGSFGFVSCQFAFHHMADKAGVLRSAYAALRPAGRFVMRNLCPQRSRDWLYYEYFPEAQRVDLHDFWPPDEIVRTMEAIGFVAVGLACEEVSFEQNLAAWLETVRRRDTCSQLQAISDAGYVAGLRRLEHDVADPNAPRSRRDQLCLVTIAGDVPGRRD